MGETELVLRGLSGDNLLAFLAGVGTLRVLTRAWPGRRVRLVWRGTGGWRPAVLVDGPSSEGEVVESLLGAMAQSEAAPEFAELGADLPALAEVFRARAVAVAEQAGPDDPVAEFLVAYGCEVPERDGKMQDTAFRTMSGAGHQHLLGSFQELAGGDDGRPPPGRLVFPVGLRRPAPVVALGPAGRPAVCAAWERSGGQRPFADPHGAGGESVGGGSAALFPGGPGGPGGADKGLSGRRR